MLFLNVDASVSTKNSKHRRKAKAKKVRRPLKDMYAFEDDELEQVILRPTNNPKPTIDMLDEKKQNSVHIYARPLILEEDLPKDISSIRLQEEVSIWQRRIERIKTTIRNVHNQLKERKEMIEMLEKEFYLTSPIQSESTDLLNDKVIGLQKLFENKTIILHYLCLQLTQSDDALDNLRREAENMRYSLTSSEESDSQIA